MSTRNSSAEYDLIPLLAAISIGERKTWSLMFVEEDVACGLLAERLLHAETELNSLDEQTGAVVFPFMSNLDCT